MSKWKVNRKGTIWILLFMIAFALFIWVVTLIKKLLVL